MEQDDPERPRRMPTLWNKTGRVSTAGKPRKRSIKAAAKLERRARWVINEFVRDPTYTYYEMLAAICERFECGRGAAEEAYARAGELEAEMLGTVTPGKLVALYFELLDEARAAGKFNAARAIIDSIFDKTGMSAPTKHEFSMAAGHTMQQVAHVTVLGMTPNQRAQREVELRGKMTKAALAKVDDRDVIDVDQSGAVVDPPAPTLDEAMAELDKATGPDEVEPDDGADTES